MAGPWEKYVAAPAVAPAEQPQGPWLRYQQGAAQPAPAAAPSEPGATPISVASNAAAGLNESIVAGGLGAPVNAATAILNLAGSGANWLAGRELVPEIRNPVGGSESIKHALGLVGANPDTVVPQNETERLARSAARGVGDAVSIMAPAGLVRGATRAGTAVNEIAGALTSQPVLQAAAGAAGGAVAEATDSPLAGLAASAALPLAAGAAGRAVSPLRSTLNAEQQRLATVARQEGIPLTPAQTMGSRPLRTMEAVFDQLPLTAEPQAAIRDAQQVAFNRAALRRAGVEADRATPDVLDGQRQRLGATFDDLAARNEMRIDDTLQQDMGRIERDASRNLTPDMARLVQNRFDDLLARVETGDVVPGRAYQVLLSDIGRQIKTSDGPVRAALGDFRDAIRTAMDRSISPADAEAWSEVRRQYAALKTIAGAMDTGSVATSAGDVAPTRLSGSARQIGNQGYAFGRGDMNDLARLGRAFIAETTPNSGSAQRISVGSLLTGAGVLGGTSVATNSLLPLISGAASIGLPRAVQAAYNNPLMRLYLENQVAAGYAPTNALAGIGGADVKRRAEGAAGAGLSRGRGAPPDRRSR